MPNQDITTPRMLARGFLPPRHFRRWVSRICLWSSYWNDPRLSKELLDRMVGRALRVGMRIRCAFAPRGTTSDYEVLPYWMSWPVRDLGLDELVGEHYVGLRFRRSFDENRSSFLPVSAIVKDLLLREAVGQSIARLDLYIPYCADLSELSRDLRRALQAFHHVCNVPKCIAVPPRLFAILAESADAAWRQEAHGRVLCIDFVPVTQVGGLIESDAETIEFLFEDPMRLARRSASDVRHVLHPWTRSRGGKREDRRNI